MSDKLINLINLSDRDVICSEHVGLNPGRVTHAHVNSHGVLIQYCEECHEDNIQDKRAFRTDTLSLSCHEVCPAPMCDESFKISHVGLTEDLKLVALCDNLLYADGINLPPVATYTSEDN